MEGRDEVTVLNAPRPELRGGTLAEALLATHRCYLDEIRILRAAVTIRSIAHLTGGGWEGNLPRALPVGLGAVLDRETWTVPPLFTLLVEWGEVAETEAFDTWNMGIGLVVVIPAADERAALRALPDAIRIGVVEPARTGAPRVRWA